MDITRIDKELELFSLKIKLLSTLKCYLNNTPQSEIQFFNRILDLLKQKYTDNDDFNFVEQGIRNHLQNYRNNLQRAIIDISSYIYNYNNGYLLNDLLNSIDTGIIYRLENTGIEVVGLQEDIPNIL
jgi:hypothetical protein